MSRRSMLKRIEKLEQLGEQIAEERSRSSPDCICFPAKEPPFFGFPIEEEIAHAVKCPLHGDRFRWSCGSYIYVPKWFREKMSLRNQQLGARFQKAWVAGFPSDLWPAEEEATDVLR
jgi:hypothetical protein